MTTAVARTLPLLALPARLAAPTPQYESPAGPSLVSIALRPGAAELWCVDRVSSSVAVDAPGAGSILRSIRVGAEPHGIAFRANGDAL